MIEQNAVDQVLLITQNCDSTQVKYLYLDEIRRDGGTQPRAAINSYHVKLLSQQIELREKLEPVVVFDDGECYWLADGFHRWQAHYNQQEEMIACLIYEGSRRDAVLYSVGANANNKPALPRSNQDKQRAVLTLLTDPEWKLWSDREIARQCKVSDRTVNRLRLSICDNDADTKLNKERKVQRGGKTYTVNTINIGKKTSKQVDAKCVKIKDGHPLFSGQLGVITQLPNATSAIVELSSGDRELINLEDLEMEQPSDNNKPELAHHLKLASGGLVEIYAPNNSKINARLGIIANVADYTVKVWVRDVERMTMQLHTLKHQQVEPVSMEEQPQLRSVRSRIYQLKQCDLDPYEVEMINLLERAVAFTPVELEYLAYIEQRKKCG